MSQYTSQTIISYSQKVMAIEVSQDLLLLQHLSLQLIGEDNLGPITETKQIQKPNYTKP